MHLPISVTTAGPKPRRRFHHSSRSWLCCSTKEDWIGGFINIVMSALSAFISPGRNGKRSSGCCDGVRGSMRKPVWSRVACRMYCQTRGRTSLLFVLYGLSARMKLGNKGGAPRDSIRTVRRRFRDCGGGLGRDTLGSTWINNSRRSGRLCLCWFVRLVIRWHAPAAGASSCYIHTFGTASPAVKFHECGEKDARIMGGRKKIGLGRMSRLRGGAEDEKKGEMIMDQG